MFIAIDAIELAAIMAPIASSDTRRGRKSSPGAWNIVEGVVVASGHGQQAITMQVVRNLSLVWSKQAWNTHNSAARNIQTMTDQANNADSHEPQQWTPAAWIEWLKEHPECRDAASDCRMTFTTLPTGQMAVARNTEAHRVLCAYLTDDDAARRAQDAGVPVSLKPPYLVARTAVELAGLLYEITAELKASKHSLEHARHAVARLKREKEKLKAQLKSLAEDPNDTDFLVSPDGQMVPPSVTRIAGAP